MVLCQAAPLPDLVPSSLTSYLTLPAISSQNHELDEANCKMLLLL